MATDNLLQVLEGYEHERIELGVTFLNQALVAATLNDNHECVGKLIKMGATNIDECIQLAKEKGIINATAMLMLLKAALTGDKSWLSVFGDAVLSPEFVARLNQIMSADTEVKSDINRAIGRQKISTIYPLEIAQQNGHHSVVYELLLLSHNKALSGSVNWNNLCLTSFDNRLIKKMYNWVRVLDLSSNKIRSIPGEIGILTEVSW